MQHTSSCEHEGELYWQPYGSINTNKLVRLEIVDLDDPESIIANLKRIKEGEDANTKTKSLQW